MLFTENRYDRSMEQMMKGIPNFYPRGSGIVVTGNFRYTAEMCDCEYCGYYGGKKKGCLVPKCVCLEERISVGIASVKEIMTETMSEIRHGGFLRRLRRYIKESEAIPMTFINEKHRLTFDEALTRLNKYDKKNTALMSALYLLTADYRLWLQTKRFVENHGIAVLLVFTVIVLAACSVDLSTVKAAEIGNSVNLDSYGEYISNDELGKLVSYGGYISKREYAAQHSDNSVGASYNPSFAGCYDTNGYQITVRRAMAGQYVGESALMIYVNGSRAYCIQPGAALNTGSSLTQTTSSGVWASLSANQKEAVNVALCYGREGNFSNIKGSSSINSDQCYIATQLIIWEIIKGERNPTAPYSLKGNGYLSMYCTDGHNGNIANAYHKIESAMASAKAIPSFAGKSSSDAPLYTLNATYNNIKKAWSYTPLTLTDSNSVLSQFAGFNNKTLDVGNATVTVKVSGNKITLTPSAGKLNATSKEVTLEPLLNCAAETGLSVDEVVDSAIKNYLERMIKNA